MKYQGLPKGLKKFQQKKRDKKASAVQSHGDTLKEIMDREDIRDFNRTCALGSVYTLAHKLMLQNVTRKEELIDKIEEAFYSSQRNKKIEVENMIHNEARN